MCGWSKKRENKKFSIRGQITLFVIVGIVIFSVFAFALYARAKIVTAQLNAQSEKQIKEYIDRNAIAQYVTGCLDAVSEEVIVRAMLQGGTFNFSNQIENQDYIVFNDSKYSYAYNQTMNVSIVVKPNLACPFGGSPSEFIVYPEPTPTGLPDYPYACGHTSISNLGSIYRGVGVGPCKNSCTSRNYLVYSGFFGVNNLKRLCSSDGANKPLEEIQTLPNYNTPNYISCDYYSGRDKSLQQYIEEEMDAGITKCLNLTEIMRRSPSNITVNDTPKSEIQFRNNGFTVRVYYPFTITLRNRQPITKLIDFSVEKDVPIKELYEFTYELVNYDVKKAEFDIVNNRMNVLSQSNRRPNSNVYTSNYIVQLIRGNESNNYTDIIRVIDEEHKLRELPLVINMGFVNRRPVLDYIHMSSSQLFDIMAVENDTLELNPAGYDPDNDYIVYDYAFWREDYVDEYNMSDSKCEKPENIYYVIENCTKMDVNYEPPHNWTNSSIYKSTQRNATYKITAQDAGFHTVRVTVRDVMHNLEDYQVVRILVFDLPQAKIKGDNFYDDVPDNYASYEDLYVLNGSESLVSVMATALGYGFSSFYWLDQREPFDKNVPIISEQDKVLFFPNVTTIRDVSATILNITEYIFRNRSETSMLHNISLTVTMQTVGLSNTAYYGVNVTQCLNHSSDINPYPYNTFPDNLIDALKADHRCCTDDMTYEGTNTECYNKAMYGMNRNFPDYTTIEPSPVTNMRYPVRHYDGENYLSNDQVIISPYDNDVFKQNFIRYCSGDRGNTCTGDGDDIRTVFNPCNDDNYDTPNVERCSGPENIYKAVDDGMECTTYAGYTFEYFMHELDPQTYPEATGSCTGSEREYANTDKFGQGKYVCYGTCTEGGKCVPTDCICSWANYAMNSDFDEEYEMNQECDGRILGSTQRDSCIINNYREDRCVDCVLKESAICKYTADGTCGASKACNGSIAGSNLQTYNNAGSTGIRDMCTNDCQVVDSSNMCTKSNMPGVDSTTTTNCIGRSPYQIILSGAAYCDGNCVEVPCNGFKIVGSGNGMHCTTSCSVSNNILSGTTPTSNLDCASGKICCNKKFGCGDKDDNTCWNAPSSIGTYP